MRWWHLVIRFLHLDFHKMSLKKCWTTNYSRGKCFTHSGMSARWQEIQGIHEGTRSTKFRIPVKIIIPPFTQCLINCVKHVRIRSYFGPHSPAFWLKTQRYSVSLRIRSECGKIWTRITSNTDTFYAVKEIKCFPVNEGSHFHQVWKLKSY